MTRPAIFISCVSKEFAGTRTLVANIITRLGYRPEFQDIFGTESGDLTETLKNKIDACKGLVQIVGESYGAEPPVVDPEFGRVSYTQFEFLYARKKHKKTWVIIAGQNCVRDNPLDTLDLPRDLQHPEKHAYQQERRSLQQIYRQSAFTTHLRHSAETTKDIELAAERLRNDFERLTRAERLRFWAIALGLALISLGVLVSYKLLKAKNEEAIQVTERSAKAVQGSVASSTEKVIASQEAVGAQVTQQIGALIKEIPGAKVPVVLAASQENAVAYNPIGMNPLGRLPLDLNSVPGNIKTVVVSSPGHEPRFVQLSSKQSNVSIELPAAEQLLPGRNYWCETLKLAFIWIPAGKVQIGSIAGVVGATANERPLTQVTITRGFWISAVETTNDAMSRFEVRYGAPESEDSRMPAQGVSWNEAMGFCEKVSKFEQREGRLGKASRFALPTEAEWEYVCRGNSATRFWTGDEESSAESAIWHRDNSSGHAHPVALKQPNIEGIYDLCGNVEEWCQDWYGTYPGGQVADPSGPKAGIERVTRGGSYEGFLIRDCRSASRQKHAPGDLLPNVGFRMVIKSEN